MEEIANQIFIEQNSAGVVYSVLKLKRGLLMIDGPCTPEDRQAWQQKLINLGGGIGRLTVLLDPHTDRLMSLPLVEAPILAQENALDIIRDLPTTARPSEKQTGSCPDSQDLPQNNRWPLPDMTYTQQVNLYWDYQPVTVTHQPGAHTAGSWVRYETEKIIFVGDSVMIQQPPFLAWCQLDRWIEELTWLSSDFFKYYQIISGRDGLIEEKSLLGMIDFLNAAKTVVTDLVQMENPDEGIAQCLPGLIKYFRFDREMEAFYQNRLTGELKKLLKRTKLEDSKGEMNACV
jgi:glyoxylase-like metal-dependent hydrolase (beta-lactamase superfamily II)